MNNINYLKLSFEKPSSTLKLVFFRQKCERDKRVGEAGHRGCGECWQDFASTDGEHDQQGGGGWGKWFQR